MLSDKAYQNIFVRVKNTQKISFTQVIFENKPSQEKFTSILYEKKILHSRQDDFSAPIKYKSSFWEHFAPKIALHHALIWPWFSTLFWDTTAQHYVDARRIDVMVGSPSQNYGKRRTIFGFLESCLWQKGLGVSHPTWRKNDDQPSIHWLNQKTHVRLSIRVWTLFPETVIRPLQGLLNAFYYQDTDKKTDRFLSSNFLHACMLYKVNSKRPFFFSFFFFSWLFCLYMSAGY